MFNESNVIVLARCNREPKEKNRQRSPDACVKQVLTVLVTRIHAVPLVHLYSFI